MCYYQHVVWRVYWSSANLTFEDQHTWWLFTLLFNFFIRIKLLIFFKNVVTEVLSGYREYNLFTEIKHTCEEYKCISVEWCVISFCLYLFLFNFFFGDWWQNIQKLHFKLKKHVLLIFIFLDISIICNYINVRM